jgi:hypothetical protein
MKFIVFFFCKIRTCWQSIYSKGHGITLQGIVAEFWSQPLGLVLTQACGLGHGVGLWLQHILGGHGRSGQQGHDLQQQLDEKSVSRVNIMIEVSFVICDSTGPIFSYRLVFCLVLGSRAVVGKLVSKLSYIIANQYKLVAALRSWSWAALRCLLWCAVLRCRRWAALRWWAALRCALWWTATWLWTAWVAITAAACQHDSNSAQSKC